MNRPLALLATIAACTVGVVFACLDFWACDDAFISFRYAENLVNGHGLVFNPGEQVEGYTNFAWTMLIAASIWIGLDPIWFANVAGVLFFAGTLALLVFGGTRTATGKGNRWPAFPGFAIAAIGLALHEHARVFTTCGLETAMFTFLATALLLVSMRATSNRAFLWAGLLGVLATMTRPDGVLFYGIAGLTACAVARSQRRFGPVVAVALPGLVLYLPYFLWKWSYYGYPFPNTFYAKSASSPYPDQGLFYVTLYFRMYWVVGIGLLGTILALIFRGQSTDSAIDSRRAPMVTLGFVATYLAFVIWVGGDFMFARFVLPITPALLLGFDLLRSRFPSAALSWALALLVGVGVVVKPTTPAQKPGGVRGVVEERRVYGEVYRAYYRKNAELLRDVLRGTEPRFAIMGGQAMLAFWGQFPLVIECSTGLTDEHLAHFEIEHRGRIGHEKGVLLDPTYLFRRGIHFTFNTSPEFDRLGLLRAIRFGEIEHDGITVPTTGVIVTYDRKVMDTIRDREGVEFIDFPTHLDTYLQTLADKPLAEVRADYDSFRSFYFDHNDDPARENSIRARLGLD